MPSETDPVSDDEFVYRRVLKNWYDEYAPNPEDRVNRLAFRPTPEDVDGLSIYRAQFLDPEQLDRDGSGMHGRYYVACIPVRSLRALGLSVHPSPNKPLPGHCLVPEVNAGLRGEAKRRSKEVQLELARLAGKNIVYEPPMR
jgi:hypothetical protein